MFIGFVRFNRTKALKKRDIYLAGLTLTPTEYTPSGAPSTSSAVIRKLAGYDPHWPDSTHMQTVMIYKLGFNQNFYTFTSKSCCVVEFLILCS